MNDIQQIKESLNPGEHYAGIILGKDGAPDYHLIVVEGETEGATWQKAMDWAKALGAELPNLRELGLARVNAREHFEDDWYWSSTQHVSDSGSAWFQYFLSGRQLNCLKYHKLRARAVRRLPI